MEKITSRKNQYIARLRRLASDGAFRRETGETVLDGEKLLREALKSGVEITGVLWAGEPSVQTDCPVYQAPPELVEYASPVRCSPGPVFSLRLPRPETPERPKNAIVLESIQDPGNVGTVIRAADALGAGPVILVGSCADVTSPRVVRATMGAAFRHCVAETDLEGLPALLRRFGLTLYGAALSEDAADIRSVDITHAAVAVGNEGHGLSPRLLALCEKRVIIPISPESESLNAAVAAALIMWEMAR